MTAKNTLEVITTTEPLRVGSSVSV